MLIDLRGSPLRLSLVIFVLSYGIVSLVYFLFSLPNVNYDLEKAAAQGVIGLIYIGIPVALGLVLIFLGLHLKVKGDIFEGYVLLLGLGAFILAWVATFYYLLSQFD